jgi:hypothetical protein
MEVLTSPHFLYRFETRAVPGRTAARDSLALASRISHFLWSSSPDEELLGHAEKGLTAEGIETQVRRLLKDPRSQALALDFANYWIPLERLQRDPRLGKLLGRAMQQETEHFFAGIVRDDRSILEFLDADYTFANEALAGHYGITGVQGDQMRRVTLAGDQRGGLLTQGSVLRATSGINSTTPVLRGKWVVENLLGSAPVRPPLSVVEALQNAPRTFGPGSMRQQMEQHRAEPSCAACHARMDTIGLALESYGPTGAWRTDADGQAIEPAGALPDGDTVNDPAELKAYLLKHRKEFVRALSERLLAYSLGRKLTDRDRAALAHVPDRVAAHDFRFSAVVLAVTQSEPFLAGWGGVDEK